MKKIIIIFILIMNSALDLKAEQAGRRLVLWYDKPAKEWVEALPIGNGRLGAMVFGNVTNELIQLNEDTFWSGGPYDPTHDDALAALPEIRRLIFADRYKEAHNIAEEQFMARPKWQMAYQPVGDLMLEFPFDENFKEYYRELDIENATAFTRFKYKNITYSREIFASNPDQVIVIRLSADKPSSVSFKAALKSPQDSEIKIEDKNQIVMRGIGPEALGIKGAIKFETRAKIIANGGKIITDSNLLAVTGADSALIIIAIATSYSNYKNASADEQERVRKYFRKLGNKTFDKMRKEHIADYQQLFNRVEFNLGTNIAARNPTDERIKNFGGTNDPQLIELYFQFARYLLISCSRPGTQPANLQGIWNPHTQPPWGCKYTININTEMNYWPAEPANLSECHEPLLQMISELVEPGEVMAKRHYNAAGWVCHHNTDIWRTTGPIDGAFWGIWPTGGAWLATHLWTHYEYTDDMEFLKKVYPILKGSAQFFIDSLIEEPKNKWLVTSPSISPENVHPFGVSLCAGPTMDTEIIRDLFSFCVKASKILKTDPEFRKKVEQAKEKLPPFQIGVKGQLQEWLEDWDMKAPEREHRHVSHLYALFPSDQITSQFTPQLFSAAKKTLEFRGDGGTGWSLAWKINMWARLEDGDHSLKMLKNLINPGRTYPNMFDAHPPFQIDGNFGACSGIIEMLLQSRNEEIVLLPALPSEWQTGSIKGLRAKGAFEIDIAWDKGKLTELKIISKKGNTVKILYEKKSITLSTKPDTTYSLNAELKQH